MTKEDVSVREIQLEQLEILKEVKRICEKHDIQFFLSSGTLLGAVRHGGAIPWDDDIDICMPLNEYDKFLKVCSDELGEQYFLQTFYTDKHYNLSYAKIRKNNTAMIRSNRVNHRIHQGVWLDVFILVGCSSRFSFTLKRNMLKFMNFLQMDSYVIGNEQEMKKLLGNIGWLLLQINFKVPIDLRIALHKYLLLLVTHTGRNDKYIAEMWSGITDLYDRDIFDGVEMVQFEGDQYPAPIGYKKYLTNRYGDYMELPPIESRIGHGADMIIDLKNDYSLYCKDKKNTNEK